MAGILFLKIFFPYQQLSKMMKFTPITLVKEVKYQLCKELSVEDPEIYGLFCPSQNGFWLDEEQTLISYELWNQEVVEFKKKQSRILNIIYQGSVIKVPTDDDIQISQQIPSIIKKAGVTSFDNFELYWNNKRLDKSKTFLEQGIEELDTTQIFLKKEIILGFSKKIQPKQTKKKKKEKIESLQPIFGKPLINSLYRGEKPLEIPSLVTKVINFIEKNGLTTEGIYRKSGALNVINRLKELFDQSDDIDLETIITSPHDATGILKLYLRELPEPPLTWDFYEKFVEIDDIPQIWEKMRKLRWLVQCLPKANFDIVFAICKHLNLVASHSTENQMGLANLAMLIGTNLLRSIDDSMAMVISDTKHQYSISSALISEYQYIFLNVEKNFVPPFAKALFDYKAQEDTEITLTAGSIIEIANMDDESWWTGKLPDGTEGFVPSSYVEIIPGYIPPTSENKDQQPKKPKKLSGRANEEMNSIMSLLNDEQQLRLELESKNYDLAVKLQELSQQFENETEEAFKIETFLHEKFGVNFN